LTAIERFRNGRKRLKKSESRCKTGNKEIKLKALLDRVREAFQLQPSKNNCPQNNEMKKPFDGGFSVNYSKTSFCVCNVG
jgi:uncharacterized Fe-S cluster-containing protein